MRRQIVSAAAATKNVTEVDVPEALMPTVSNTKVADGLSPDDYKDKLLKHIPAEAIAVFLTLTGVIASSATGTGLTIGLWVAFALGVLGTPGYLWRLQGVTDPLQLGVSTVSFVAWALATGAPFTLYGWYNDNPWIGPSFMVAYTFLIPLILGKPKAQQG